MGASALKPIRAIHTPLLALFPVLSLYASNAGLLPLAYAFRPALVALGAACCLWLILTLVLRDAVRASLCVSAGVATLIGFGQFAKADPASASPTARVLVAAGVALTIAFMTGKRFKLPSLRWAIAPILTVAGFVLADFLLRALRVQIGRPVGILVVAPAAIFFALLWPKNLLRQATLLLNAFSVILVILPALSAINVWISGRSASPTANAAAPGAQHAAAGQMPDVYFIVLDAFGREDSLQRVFGYSSHPFVEGLRKRGFYVPDHSRSNYCQTHQSLTATLNLGYIPEVLPNADDLMETREPLSQAIDDNAVANRLRQRGYRYVQIMSAPGLIHAVSADLVFQDTRGLNPLETALLDSAPMIAPTEVQEDVGEVHRQRIFRALSDLSSLPSSRFPRFVFAHFLAPHPPFLFKADGSNTGLPPVFADGDHYCRSGGLACDYKTYYPQQAEFISRRILQCIDDIQQRSAVPPIIMVIGDHGSRIGLDLTDADKSDLEECFSNLTAVLAPKATLAKMYPTITPVNLMRLVMGDLTGESLPKLPDRSLYSTWQKPYSFLDVTDRLDALEASAIKR